VFVEPTDSLLAVDAAFGDDNRTDREDAHR
jgi:hypothetical protein